MAVQNRTTLIEKTHKVLKKHYKPIESPRNRNVLEHLLYGLILENSPYELADKAFEKIREVSFDWNEVRVSSVAELAEMMHGMGFARHSAANVKRILHSIFETQYSFELENLRKENIGKAASDLHKHQGSTPFAVSYVIQNALDGHSIPLDLGALDCLYILGIIDEKERQTKTAPGLERAVPKKRGSEFSSLLHHLAADFYAAPFAKKARDILLEINPEGKDRFPKRVVRRPEPEPPPPPPPPPPTSGKASPTGKKVPPKESPKATGKESTKEPAKKGAPADVKKSAAKQPPAPAVRKPVPKVPVKKAKPRKSEAKTPPAPAKRPPPKPTRPAKGGSTSSQGSKHSTSKQLTRKKPK